MSYVNVNYASSDLRYALKPANGAQAVGKGELIINVKDYGAKVDGVTDDGPAISAAISAAVTAGYTKVLIPDGQYRIATSIMPQSYIRVEGYGAQFIGPITNYPRISSTTTVADPLSVAQQAGGGCISDISSPTVIYGASFHGISFVNFRYCFSCVQTWAQPKFEDLFFENCDVGILCYQGSQCYALQNTVSAGGNAGITFIGAATCFPSGHPYAGQDNFYCDGFMYVNDGHYRDAAAKNDAFDLWFQQSILRPDTASVVVSGSSTFLYPAGSTARNPSGRTVYIPSRNGRMIFSPTIRRGQYVGCARGAALVANPVLGHFEDINGELMFSGMNATESMLVLLRNSPTSISGNITSIDASLSTNPAKAAVEIIDSTSG